MISLEEAQEKILASIKPLPAQKVSLRSAIGRYLAAPVYSLVDLPPHDNSAMDGYAVRSADLVAATPENPVTLTLAGEAAPGKANATRFPPGACVRIFTGAMLPPEADAVVMQEDVTATLREPIKITFTEPVKPWENIRLRGEDIREQTAVGEVGECLTPQRATLLSASGIAQVTVANRPLVGLFATGDELCLPGETIAPGMIYESNRLALAGLMSSLGIIADPKPFLPDDLAVTKRSLQSALDKYDVIITSGGISVGEKDWVKKAWEDLDVRMDFWKVAIRPGKPFAFGHHGEKLLFGLPGNPVSALVTFFLLVRPALLRLQGATNLAPPKSWGALAEPLANAGDRRHFMRVIIDNEGKIRSAGSQGSHFMKSLAASDGLIDLPPKTSWPAGTPAAVLRWT